MMLKNFKTMLAVALTCFVGVASINADDPDKVIDAFLDQVNQQGSLTNEQKSSVSEAVDQLRQDDYSKSQAISSGLLVLYPEYEEALLLADDGFEKAHQSLQPMMESADKFLAADATFMMARIMMNEEHHEDALQLLSQITGEMAAFTLNSGNALYFTAVAHAGLLNNAEAIAAFEQFIEENPNAPERLKVSAWRQMEMLKLIEEGSLTDVHQRMDFSRRRLELEKTGDVTQEQQDKIVTMLDQLIKEQEKKECSSCSSCNKNSDQEGQQPADGQAQNPGKGKSNKGGNSSQPNGVVRRSFNNGPASPWSKLRDRSRDPANNAVKERLPARYRPVVEEYNESVNGSEGSNN